MRIRIVSGAAAQKCLRTISQAGFRDGPLGPEIVAQPSGSRPLRYKLNNSSHKPTSAVSITPSNNLAAASSERPAARRTSAIWRYDSEFSGSSLIALAAASNALKHEPLNSESYRQIAECLIAPEC